MSPPSAQAIASRTEVLPCLFLPPITVSPFFAGSSCTAFIFFTFYKTREDFDRGLGDAARSLREKGIEPVKKMDYDGKQYMSV